MARSQRGRGNWGLRAIALLGSAGAFFGFWQMAIRVPHPLTVNGAAQLTPTPTDSYTIPTGPTKSTPLPLPGPPNGSTGLSH